MASDRRRRLGLAAADSIPACRPWRVDLPALCRRRCPEIAERDLIGAWQLASIEACPLDGRPLSVGGDLNDRDRCGRTQGLVDGGRGRRGRS